MFIRFRRSEKDSLFDTTSNFKWKMGQILWAFSEYLNFKKFLEL